MWNQSERKKEGKMKINHLERKYRYKWLKWLTNIIFYKNVHARKMSLSHCYIQRMQYFGVNKNGGYIKVWCCSANVFCIKPGTSYVHTQKFYLAQD